VRGKEKVCPKKSKRRKKGAVLHPKLASRTTNTTQGKRRKEEVHFGPRKKKNRMEEKEGKRGLVGTASCKKERGTGRSRRKERKRNLIGKEERSLRKRGGNSQKKKKGGEKELFAGERREGTQNSSIG